MKYFKLILLATIVLATVNSCTDNELQDFYVAKPESIAAMEYLNKYDALKSYIDRNTDPNFKLGSGVGVSDYTKEGLVYRLSNSNFDELTAGNAMKYSSNVQDDGSMDFSNVIAFVQTAKAAGISIYGHTLAWHAQQNNKYLNSLIADKTVEPDPSTADPALHMSVPTAGSNPWDSEIYYDLSTPLVAGQEYTISMRIKASTPTSINFWPGINGGDTQYLPSFSGGEQWGPSSITFTANMAIDRLRFCFGTFAGDLYFDDLSLTATGSDENLIANPSFDDESLAAWSKPGWHSYTFGIEKVMESSNVFINVYVKEDDFSSGNAMMGWGNNSTREVVDGVHVMTNPSATNSWSAQAGYDFSPELEEGKMYFITMKIKGSVEGSISAGFQKPDGYAGRGDFPPIPITTEWKEVTVSTVCTGDATTRFLFSYGAYVGTIYIDDFALYWQKSSNTIPMTDEEKAEALTGAMDRWIAGMMTACDGYVTAWDVVNEALSGADYDGDGKYDLQSASNSGDDAANNFYWQDYLGDNDYVRTTVRLARKHFAESGGNPSDLKLFINDYNLESWWDGNGKAKSLVKWIEQWESDGVTKIDGIGTQMHVSYIMDEAAQKTQEDAIVNMFKLLAATGKLIKITELDMGITEKAFGTGLKTEQLTEEHHKAMAGFYTFIIQKYFELVPAAQRYGITQWAATDSPDSSGWREDQPIGLWDLNYNRKHTYAGFANGLAGKDLSKE